MYSLGMDSQIGGSPLRTYFLQGNKEEKEIKSEMFLLQRQKVTEGIHSAKNDVLIISKITLNTGKCYG